MFATIILIIGKIKTQRSGWPKRQASAATIQTRLSHSPQRKWHVASAAAGSPPFMFLLLNHVLLLLHDNDNERERVS